MTEVPKGILYGFLQARAMAAGADLRREVRYPSGAPARIGWSDGEGRREAVGRLLNISFGGAALSMAEPPGGPGPIQFRAERGASPWWIDAELLGIEPQADGTARLRLKFREPCPASLLRAVLSDRTAEA